MALRVTTQRRALKGLGNGVLVLMLLWTAIPFYWMIATSLKHDKEIYGYEATLIPEQPTLANYATVFRETPYMLYLRNSVAVAVGSTILSMIIAVLGAYAIARLDFPGRALLARGLVFTYLVPTSLLFIPMFAMMSVAPPHGQPARTHHRVPGIRCAVLHLVTHGVFQVRASRTGGGGPGGRL